MAQKWRTVKLRSGVKKKVRVSKAYAKKRKAEASSKFTSSKMSLFEKGELRPKSWISIGKSGMVYISRSPGTRTYWLLSRISATKWPKFRWSDRNLSFSVNSTRIVFKKSADYERAKANFQSIKQKSAK